MKTKDCWLMVASIFVASALLWLCDIHKKNLNKPSPLPNPSPESVTLDASKLWIGPHYVCLKCGDENNGAFNLYSKGKETRYCLACLKTFLDGNVGTVEERPIDESNK